MIYYSYSLFTEDRVQWFRSWAETLRWMEELELKHAELRRTIKSFETMSRVWNGISAQQSSPGAAAFTKKQSIMYDNLRKEAETWKSKGVEQLVNASDGDFVQAVLDFRKREMGWLEDFASRSYRKFSPRQS